MTIILIDCHADLKSRLAMTFEGALRARGFIFFCLYVKNTSNLSRIVLFFKILKNAVFCYFFSKKMIFYQNFYRKWHIIKNLVFGVVLYFVEYFCLLLGPDFNNGLRFIKNGYLQNIMIVIINIFKLI